MIKIALAGNPNSGKTTLFNAITGKIEKVGNWAGVTVEKKEGKIKPSIYSGSEEIVAVDLPGAYSMSPFTSEENITKEFVKNENPDAIINIVDATNLSRSLFFTTQLLELGIPVVVALNKSDMNVKKQNTINIKKLSEKIGCPVVETTATQVGGNNGLSALIQEVLHIKGSEQVSLFEYKEYDLSDKIAVEVADKARFEFVKKVVAKVEKRTTKSNVINTQDKIDKVLAHKWLGIPIFAVVMWLVFTISQTYLGPFFAEGITALPWFAEMEEVPLIMQGLVGWIDAFGGFIDGLIAESVSPLVYSIIMDGIIGGVGAVVGFLPLIMVMFFLLALLEDCGYMARVAVVMDRILKVVGLSGKSIIPMVVGIGCAIPGVMATRTIKNERQRRTTAMLTPFIPCGAKLPVIALFAGAFFDGAAWVNTTMLFVGIALIILFALIVQRITGEKNARSFFIMELPEYRVPSFIRATISMLSRAKAFIIKAATIILLCNLAVTLMQSYNWQFQNIDSMGLSPDTSILASIATPFAFLLIPLGFGVWQFAAAAITGFIAKENVVGTLATVFALQSAINTDELAIVEGSAGAIADVMAITPVIALAYLMFNLYTPPCFAAIGAMNAEMESKKWLWAGIGLQLTVGYIVAFLVYQCGTLFTTGALGTGFIPGLIAVGAMIGIISYLVIKGNKKSELKLKSAKQLQRT